VVQERARQLVSAMIHILTYFGSGLLVGLRCRTENKNLNMFLAGTLASFLGYAVVRPLISAEIILRWLYPDQIKPVKPDKTKLANSGNGRVFNRFMADRTVTS
jgi:hypothetical protein